MNISLPAKNLRTKNFLIKDGILYLRYGQSFEDVITVKSNSVEIK